MQLAFHSVLRNSFGQNHYDSDADAAHPCSVLWRITGDIAYANKSKEIISAWSSNVAIPAKERK
jgi:hypothetical protein